MDFTQLKLIRVRSKYAVSHYVRQIHDQAPSGIVTVCILFLGNMDEWDLETKTEGLVVEDNTVSMQRD